MIRRLLVAVLSVLLIAAADVAPTAVEAMPHGPLVPPGTAGRTPRALVVDSPFDALRVEAHPDLAPQTAMTVELWARREPADGCAVLVGKDRRAGYALAVCDGRLRLYLGNGMFVEDTRIVPERRWTHLAATFDGAVVRLYIDGAAQQLTPPAGDGLTAGDAELRLGADVAPGASFRGQLDHVRLWRLARGAAELRRDRFTALGPRPGLIAQWTLDGTARDLIGGHDAIPVGAASYTFAGAVPRDVTLPLVEDGPVVDGRCDPNEYAAAERVAVDSAEAPTVLLQATADDIWVCFDALERGTGQQGFAALYLDADASADDTPDVTDYRVSISYRGDDRLEVGDGAGGWRELDDGPAGWQAERQTEDEQWSAELRVGRGFLRPPAEPDAPPRAGLALAHGMSSDRSAGDLWPVDAAAAQPASWAEATLVASDVDRPRYAFRGRVRRPAEDLADDGLGGQDGVAGASLELLTWDDEQLTLVDRDRSDGDGRYALSYRGPAPEAFLVRERDPRGMVSVAAAPGIDAVPAGAGVLRYDIDPDDERFDFQAGDFIDQIGPAVPAPRGQRYLVVYTPPVTADDLWSLVEARRAQGFHVSTVSTLELDRGYRGRDLAERIHNWLKDNQTAADEQADGTPVYALLIGRSDRLPVRDVGALPTEDDAVAADRPAWPTDWYYADVDSGWDADGDGRYGEFLLCRPGDTYPDPDAEDGRRDCPEPGSLSREGPFGALRGAEDDFEAEVLVGRLPLNEPGEVRRALAAGLALERAAPDARSGVLLAGALWWYEGRAWSATRGRFVDGGAPGADPWLGARWDGVQPYGRDSADYLDTTLRSLVDPLADSLVRLYESAGPDANPFLAPSARAGDAPLSRAALQARWLDGSAAVVNVAGNGGRRGVYSGRWTHEWDGNGEIDQPARPGTCAGQRIDPLDRVGAPCDELVPEAFIDASLGAPSGHAPLVVANAGRTANVAWQLDGLDDDGDAVGLQLGPRGAATDLLGRGHASGWIGSYTAAPPGTLDGYQTAVNRGLLSEADRAGAAHWSAARSLARIDPYVAYAYGPALLGDPALAVAGHTAEALAAWPMAGGGWDGAGATLRSAPVVAETAWTTAAGTPGGPASVARDGTLYVVGRQSLLQLASDGTVLNEADLGGAAGGTMASPPAVAAGVVALARGSTVRTFDRTLRPIGTHSLPRSATATGAPRIGPNGAVWLPTSSGLARLTGAGTVELVDDALTAGGPVWTPDGSVVWTTTDGQLVRRRARLHEAPVREETPLPERGVPSAPALDGEGTVYVATDGGWVVSRPVDGPGWETDVGAPIGHAPVVDASGTIYVGDARGEVTALGSGGAELWRQTLDDAVRARPLADGLALYVPAGQRLYVLDLATGGQLAVVELGGPTDARSTPAIGPDRTLYVTRADGVLVALRESGWLAAPTDVRLVDDGAGRLAVRWQDRSAGEAGFRVEVCDRRGRCAAAGTTAAGATALTLRQLELAPGTPLRARVQAVGRVDEGILSQTVAVAQSPVADEALTQQPAATRASEFALSNVAYMPADAAQTPTQVRVTAQSSTSVEVAWSYPGDPGGLLGFRVTRDSPHGEVAVLAGVTGPDARSLIVRDLAPATTYAFRVEAESARAGASAEPVTARTWSRDLAAPTGLTARDSGDAVALRWTAGGVRTEGYVLERRDPGVAEWRVVGRVGVAARGFDDRLELLPGRYGYRVRAVGDARDGVSEPVTLEIGGREQTSVYLPWTFTPRRR